MPFVPIRDRVDDFIGPPDKNGCRPWLAGANGEGRGLFNDGKGHSKLVTRFLLERKLKRELKREELACHTCDNPWCCEIKHLWVGSDKENSEDRVAKGRQWNPVGEEHHKVKLTDKEILKIRADSRPYTEIAPDYKVHKSLIGQIKRREIWKHI